MNIVLSDLYAWDAAACRRLNRGNRIPVVGSIFATVSRLGDGVFWYVVILVQPLLLGLAPGLMMTVLMAVTGLLCTALYRWIKGRTRRPRPSEALAAMTLTVPPLDRFSFPSGHTLHAVCFTIMASWATPWLAWVLAPFAILVALSRPILGLHWPSDVLVGALIGGITAFASIQVAGLMGIA
jgi:undecaprenyl-diphosphatase